MEMLRKVQIPDPGQVMDRYPHQLSGGMAQRVLIAMALAAEPALLILDEPTTALDATVEAEVLDLVAGLRAEMSTSVLFISHNLAVIAKMCDRVGVLYAGELVEEGPASVVFDQPSHPYTVGLLRCIPRRGQRKDHGRLDAIPGFLPEPGQQITGCIYAERCALVIDECRTAPPPAAPVGPGHTARCIRHEEAAGLPRSTPADVTLPTSPGADDPIITIRGLSTTYRNAGTELKALTGIDLEIMRGETLGLVGESGSGKTTLARALLGLISPDDGSVIEFDGQPLPVDLRRLPRDLLRAVQIVFQNPDSALNRRHTVRPADQPAAVPAGQPVRQPCSPSVSPTWSGRSGWSPGTCRCGLASCPAGSSSGWRSPAPSAAARGWSSVTSRPRRWTCRSRRRS